MTHILIVGQKFSSLTQHLIDNGYDYTLLQDIVKTKFPNKKFKHRILGDFSSREALLPSLKDLPPIDGVMSVYENYILPAAWIADYLNVPGLPVAAAEACTDKFLMRSLFDKAPERISPAFATVASEDDVRTFAATHSFPLILKPANLAKSLLVTKNSTLDELIANYNKSCILLQTTYAKYAPTRTPKLIIEEFLEGSIHSVDAFIDASGNPLVLDQIVDYQTGYDIGYDDNFHYSRILPSTLSVNEQSQLRHCAEIGIRALGMKNSPAHVEIILTRDGARIVEIGARNGGYRERMHFLANNIDILDAAIAVSQGKTPVINATKDEPCAVLELFPKHPGIFQEIENLNALEGLASLTYLKVKAKEGDLIGKAADGHKMVVIVILHHSDTTIFNADLAYITNHVKVTTR